MPQPAHREKSSSVNWRRYAREFRATASSEGFDLAFIDRCLAYAHRLVKKRLPIVFDEDHFSRLVGVDLEYLRRCSNAPHCFYRTFEIAKRSGKPREIAAPLPTLKKVQQWIHLEILSQCRASRFSHAFGRGCSIRSNARFHVKQETVVAVDIKDFFSSIPANKVYQVFRECGYTKRVSGLFAAITTLDNSLPQGAPTSPVLSNLVCRQMDSRIVGYCKLRNWRYTRYADDLTFSGNSQVAALLAFLRTVLGESGFTIREEKTRVLKKHQQQNVTGVVVNNSTHPPRSFRRELRQHAFYIARHGLADHMEHREISQTNFRAHLLGKAFHAIFLDPTDRDACALIDTLQESE